MEYLRINLRFEGVQLTFIYGLLLCMIRKMRIEFRSDFFFTLACTLSLYRSIFEREKRRKIRNLWQLFEVWLNDETRDATSIKWLAMVFQGIFTNVAGEHVQCIAVLIIQWIIVYFISFNNFRFICHGMARHGSISLIMFSIFITANPSTCVDYVPVFPFFALIITWFCFYSGNFIQPEWNSSAFLSFLSSSSLAGICTLDWFVRKSTIVDSNVSQPLVSLPKPSNARFQLKLREKQQNNNKEIKWSVCV